METVPIDNTRLVDLYANEGNANPLLVACALDAHDSNEGLLFWPTWVVVSDDGAVQAKASKFEVPVRTSAEFKSIISERKHVKPPGGGVPLRPGGLTVIGPRAHTRCRATMRPIASADASGGTPSSSASSIS